MKRTLLTLLAALTLLPALADEGMWLPSLISTRIDDMRAKGFRLTAEDIYSINRASMKDAVVLFDGGCTGELISAEGLLLTNHHCGYDAIQAHSSVEHDYLTYGFWARTRAEELPNEKLNVKFLVRMEEITDRLAAGETAAEIIRAAEAEGTGYRASVEQMYYGNQLFLFVYEQFDDVRLVAAPPRRSASSAATPTTGSGRAIRATSPSSASTPRRITNRRPTRPTTSPTGRKSTSRSRRREYTRATSR